MRSPSRAKLFVLAFGLVSAVTSWSATPARADAPAAPSKGVVVARVGDHEITLDEVNRRIAGVPHFQLRSFGKNAAEIRRSYVERVMVREILLAKGAALAKMHEREDVKERSRGVLRNAMLGRIRADLAQGTGITEQDVKAYYDKNVSKFHTPARVAIWRIDTAKREDAVAILDEMKKDPSAKRWADLARDRSLDKATAQRGGNLGFVSPDGTTSEPGLKVEREIVDAAMKVKDAEIVQEPVKVGERWAVVWRRQSMRAVDRSLDMETPTIRQMLAHERLEKSIKDLLTKLRAERLTDHHPELLELVDVSGTGEVQSKRRPGSIPVAKKTGGKPVPHEHDGR